MPAARQAHPERGIVLEPACSTDLLLTENFGSSSPMVRREAVESVGGYDETVVRAEDFDFQYRVAEAYRIGIIPTLGTYKRQHPANLTADTPAVMKRQIAVSRRMLEVYQLHANSPVPITHFDSDRPQNFAYRATKTGLEALKNYES
jgi:GT2 family glycosyltransferase